MSTLEYKGFWNSVNTRPESYIKIWVSDWNKDYYGFYAYVNMKEPVKSLKAIQHIIDNLNFRDGDVYVELISYSDDQTKKYYELVDSACWFLLGEYERWLN